MSRFNIAQVAIDPPIRIRARLSHEARARENQKRRASHMAMVKAIETAERAGVKVTGEMIKAWVKILKEEK